MLSFFSDASEETRVELQRRVELDGGILMDGASPLNKKEPIRRSSSAHITVHMAQYCFSSSLHPLSLLRTFESELSWLPATKQSKTWGTCQKIKVWRLPCLATPSPPPLGTGTGSAGKRSGHAGHPDMVRRRRCRARAGVRSEHGGDASPPPLRWLVAVWVARNAAAARRRLSPARCPT